jgi:CheY-like chemotaxis protein
MKLLVVDSDRPNRQKLTEILVTLGHSVVEATSNREAVGRVKSETFDVALVGVDSAGVRGQELLRIASKADPAIRVVGVSGSSQPPPTNGRKGVQYAGFLVKPYRVEQLRGLLEEIRFEREAAALSRRLPTPGFEDGTSGRLFIRSNPMEEIHDLGMGRIESPKVLANGREPSGRRVLRIEANGTPPNLLGRLLVGSYITGQDQILVSSKKGLSSAQREEIRRMASRLLGTTVIQDGERLMEVQNFLDPGKHQLPHLVLRVVRMLETELQICRSSLAADGTGPRARIDAIEDEIDRFYLLIARQLLLSTDSPRIARQIEVESHHYQMGYRLVAKVLEVTGDRIQGIASELEENLSAMQSLPPAVGRELALALERLELLLVRTMDAFVRLSVPDANAILNAIAATLPEVSVLSDSFARHLPDRKVAVATERILCDLAHSMEMLVIVNEVTINRSVEPETVAPHGDRVSLEPSSSAPPRPGGPRPGP